MPPPASKSPFQVPADILTRAQFQALTTGGAAFKHGGNTALNLGGHVDIYTDTEGGAVAVVSLIEINAGNCAEIAPLLTAARDRWQQGQAAKASAHSQTTPATQPQ